MLEKTIALVSSYSDLIIFFAYLSAVSILVFNVFIKLNIKKSFFALCFCIFIFVCALNHLAFYLHTIADYSLFISITKVLKAITAILTSVAVWPFLKEALHFKSLSENEQQRRDLKIYKEAYEDAGIGLALLNKDGELIKANKSLTKLFEYGEDYILNSNINHFIDKEDAIKNKKLFKNIYKSSDQTFDFNLKFKKKSGKTFCGKVQLKVNRKDSGSMDFIAVQLTDISRELEIEVELQRERVNAENDRKLEYLTEMASSVAHEINNPLTIISGAAQITDIILKKETVDKELIKKEIQDINESVLRISKIIKSLKVLSNGRKEQIALFTVSEILDNVMPLCQSKFVSSNVDFEINQNENVFLKEILCNKMHMSQVILNLLINSFEAIQNSNEKWIRLNLYEVDNCMIFDITDSGPGINDELKENIYLPFFTSKKKNESSGLGLSYCKSVVENYQGSLNYIQGENTTFRIVIPLKRELKFA